MMMAMGKTGSRSNGETVKKSCMQSFVFPNDDVTDRVELTDVHIYAYLHFIQCMYRFIAIWPYMQDEE